jgi:hypothetical protein
MKTSFGHCHRTNDGLLIGKPRSYTRYGNVATGYKKRKSGPREKVAIIKLRRLGYSINQLSKAFSRSTSFIHKAIRTGITRGIIHMVQMRKLPSAARLRCSSIRRKTLDSYIQGWLMFAAGIGDKPP